MLIELRTRFCCPIWDPQDQLKLHARMAGSCRGRGFRVIRVSGCEQSLCILAERRSLPSRRTLSELGRILIRALPGSGNESEQPAIDWQLELVSTTQLRATMRRLDKLRRYPRRQHFW